jgi:hypothetical protein
MLPGQVQRIRSMKEKSMDGLSPMLPNQLVKQSSQKVEFIKQKQVMD